MLRPPLLSCPLAISLALACCFGVSPAVVAAQTDGAAVADPGRIALQLQSRQRVAGVNYADQLARAERDFEAGDYPAAAERLTALSERTFLDSRAIELTYRVQRATGEDRAAEATLREGLATYPHAVRLLRIGPTEAAARGELSVEDVEGERRYPQALKAELKAGLAFRQNRPTTALLEAERAAYLYDGRYELGPDTRRAVAEAYAALLSPPLAATPSTATPSTAASPAATPPVGEPGLSFDEAYARAYGMAVARLRGGGDDGVAAEAGASGDGLLAAAKLRAVALRLFVREGGLARWPDPMLIDLYVLDRAGHLETATALQLAWLAPAEALRFERAAVGPVSRARRYMAEDWRDAADAWRATRER